MVFHGGRRGGSVRTKRSLYHELFLRTSTVRTWGIDGVDGGNGNAAGASADGGDGTSGGGNNEREVERVWVRTIWKAASWFDEHVKAIYHGRSKSGRRESRSILVALGGGCLSWKLRDR
uniref:Uncharacterized protein n=1 Tax=Vespula pensylvanica TaxID=30213 RepID=A0A834N7Y4_VESPE|nr:hypothetical protein H0235_016217 [Vespula pensylvanica]